MNVEVPIFKTVLIGKTNFSVRYNENRFEVDGTTSTLMLITGRADKLVGSAAE
ncbi:MAG: hypothetical protein KAR03_04915 [Candidatus Thorarchaeota archaeon]|nr:hypothetical protein [Candidatus Thorarchaeota archaeon]